MPYIYEIYGIYSTHPADTRIFGVNFLVSNKGRPGWLPTLKDLFGPAKVIPHRERSTSVKTTKLPEELDPSLSVDLGDLELRTTQTESERIALLPAPPPIGFEPDLSEFGVKEPTFGYRSDPSEKQGSGAGGYDLNGSYFADDVDLTDFGGLWVVVDRGDAKSRPAGTQRYGVCRVDDQPGKVDHRRDMRELGIQIRPSEGIGESYEEACKSAEQMNFIELDMNS
jgi:hypothetical protein